MCNREAKDTVNLLSSPECSVSAAVGSKRAAVRSTPASPDLPSMQPGKRDSHVWQYGCISPTWQRAQQRRPPTWRREDTSEEQPRWVAATLQAHA